MKTLIIFSHTKLEDMIEKGNLDYISYYEKYFDRVYVLYMAGNKNKVIRNGKILYISKNFNNEFLNLFLSPFKLYNFYKKHKKAKFLTADMIFSWYVTLLLKFTDRKIYLMPVAIPSEIYKSSGKSMTGILPFWIESFFIRLSIYSCNYIYTSINGKFYEKELNLNNSLKDKFIMSEISVDELPNKVFYEPKIKREQSDNINLIYVGRLHEEKLVKDIIHIFSIVNQKVQNANLYLIGNGSEEKKLKKLVIKYGLEKKVFFEGYKNNVEIKNYLDNSDIFISPLTGTSLREAFLRQIPVVAYDIDWVKTMFKHRYHLLKSEKGDFKTFAGNIIELTKNDELRDELSKNAYELGINRWGLDKLRSSLQYTFDRD